VKSKVVWLNLTISPGSETHCQSKIQNSQYSQEIYTKAFVNSQINNAILRYFPIIANEIKLIILSNMFCLQ
jgi:hypothetical protein